MVNIVLVLLLFLNLNFNNDPVVYLVGDATVANNPIEDNPERGWGQMFSLFFNDSLKIINFAKNGRSTKSFINEGLWQKVLDKLEPGDYVFIQFGHNDQKILDTNRYAEAHTTYKQNLVRYVNESKAKGAIPVLITPVNRRKFNENGKFVDQHGDYPSVVRNVAAEMDVPLIDLHKKSEKVFSELGSEKTKELFLWIQPNKYKTLPEGKMDNTHFSEAGAMLVAGLVVEELKELAIPINKYLKIIRQVPN